MIDVLVFSKNRAAQLDLLLTSIERYAPFLYGLIYIEWTATTAAFADPYRAISARLPLRFGHEQDFEPNVRAWLDHAGPLVSFLVDDDVFYQQAQWAHVPATLRLPAGRYRWADHDPYSDKGYPLSLDGNIYRKETILPLLEGLHFDNPTQLEAGLDSRRHLFEPSTIYSAGQSLVGIPANRVSDSSNMPHMGLDPWEMNEKYLAGWRIDLDATFAGVEVTGAHQNIQYAWKRP